MSLTTLTSVAGAANCEVLKTYTDIALNSYTKVFQDAEPLQKQVAVVIEKPDVKTTALVNFLKH